MDPLVDGSEREVLTWDLYGRGVRDLAQQIADDGYAPDILLGIARGGLIPAGSIGYALSIKNCYLINVEYYTDIDERLEVPVILPPYLDMVDLNDADVLVVDDVADTGHTLQKVYEFVADKVNMTRAAVLYEKPQSAIRCEYVWRRTDKWIDFPWSSEPPIVPPPTR
ncbi:MAG: phosphoribosyltransferase family protein [Acidimicrobiia bacterium]|nr:phosphoribosyltransferase family protein [Acidimicrobiia bacterium]